jgi:hypothetical protein
MEEWCKLPEAVRIALNDLMEAMYQFDCTVAESISKEN